MGKEAEIIPSYVVNNIATHTYMDEIDSSGYDKEIFRTQPSSPKPIKSNQREHEIGWGHAPRGRFSKEWVKIQDVVDKAEKRSQRPGMMVNLMCIIWEEMINMWKARNGVQHGVTKEERRKRANGRLLPLVRSAYHTRHLDISLYNMSLFRLTLEERLQMEPRKN